MVNTPSWLKPLNAVLLPDTVPADTLSQLNPAGSEALDGAQLLLVNGATAPETAELLPRPFPRVLWYGTTAGLIVGAALGLLFGRLLFNGTIVPTDWEGIFSLAIYIPLFLDNVGSCAGPSCRRGGYDSGPEAGTLRTRRKLIYLFHEPRSHKRAR